MTGGEPWDGASHAIAGMAVQFILMGAMSPVTIFWIKAGAGSHAFKLGHSTIQPIAVALTMSSKR